jgi:hypothetical protein
MVRTTLDFFNLQRSQALHTRLRALSSAEDVDEALGGEAIKSIIKCQLVVTICKYTGSKIAPAVVVERIVRVAGH